MPDRRTSVGVAEGRPPLLMGKRGAAPGLPVSALLLDWGEDRITVIRDFHCATNIMDGLRWSTIPPA